MLLMKLEDFHWQSPTYIAVDIREAICCPQLRPWNSTERMEVDIIDAVQEGRSEPLIFSSATLPKKRDSLLPG